MRKSWSAVKRFDPNAVVFLGDMMDNGRFASDDEECVFITIMLAFLLTPASNLSSPAVPYPSNKTSPLNLLGFETLLPES